MTRFRRSVLLATATAIVLASASAATLLLFQVADETARAPTASETLAARIEARSLVVVSDVPLPTGMSVLVGTYGYGHGHGGAFEVRRAFSSGTGGIRLDTLYLPPRDQGTVNITSVVAGPGGWPLYLALCRGAECPLEGESKTDAVTTFFRSDDGGVSWGEKGRRQGEWWLLDVVGDEAIALAYQPGGATYVTLPTGAPIRPPPDARSGITRGSPLRFNGRLVWIARSGPSVVDNDGNVLFRLPYPDGKLLSVLPGGPHGLVAAVFTTPQGTFLGTFSQEGLAQPLIQLPEGIEPAAWLDYDTLLVDAEFMRDATCGSSNSTSGVMPAVVRLSTGILSFIPSPFLDGGCSRGAQRVIAVQAGPLARVNSPGDCLNVRGAPRADASLVDCLADHVLVTLSGSSIESDGRTWLGITTPSGKPGWAASAFLER